MTSGYDEARLIGLRGGDLTSHGSEAAAQLFLTDALCGQLENAGAHKADFIAVDCPEQP